MQYERDKQKVRVVGGLAVGIGAILMILTIFITLFELLASAGRGDVVRGFGAFAIGLVMASTMMGAGGQLTRLRYYAADDVYNMRMAWTGLLLVMLLGGILAIWFIPPLTSLAAFIIFLLMIVRPAVIRLSSN
jgi:hypothetical protein